MPKAAETEVTSHHLDVSALLLDDENPRLPEDLHGKSQRQLLEYLYETANLVEIAQSLVDNDFFTHEPLIVLQPNRSRRVVVEGNRRLAALQILLELPVAQGLHFVDLAASSAKKRALERVPCFEVRNRQEVYKFLGFRHIGGIQTWSAEAKARYIYREVEAEVQARSEDVFAAVSRRIGLEKGAVRTSFLAYAVIHAAREKLDVDVSHLLSHDERRFGVWTRSMNSPDIRAHIGLGEITTYPAITHSLRKLNKSAVREVLNDIAPAHGMPEVLPDSRDVTLYGRILRNQEAHSEMRRTRSLESARAIVERERLPIRLQKIVRQVSRLATDVLGAEKGDLEELREHLVEMEDAIERLRRAIRGVAKS